MTPIKPATGRRTLATAVVVGLTLPAGAAAAYASEDESPTDTQIQPATTSEPAPDSDADTTSSSDEQDQSHSEVAANDDPEPEPEPEPDVEVTPDAPGHDEASNSVTVPEQEAVIWSHGPGTVEVPEGGLTVTATPAEGYTFPDGATREWHFDHQEEDEAPVVDEVVLSAEADQVDSGDSVSFSVAATDEDGQPVTVEPSDVTLNGLDSDDEADGLQVSFHGEGQRSITATVDGVESAPVTITVEDPEPDYDPQFSAEGSLITGADLAPGGTYDLRITTRRGFTIGSTELVANDSGTGSVDVDGVGFTRPGSSYRVHITGPEDFSTRLNVTIPDDDDGEGPGEPAPEPETVTPPQPSHSSTENMIYLSQQEGVVWSTGPGAIAIPEGGLTVTASPAEGYTFPDGTQTTWTFDFTSSPGPQPEPDPGPEPDPELPVDPQPQPPTEPAPEPGPEPTSPSEPDDEDEDDEDSQEQDETSIAADSDLQASASDDDQSSHDWQGTDLPQAQGDLEGALESTHDEQGEETGLSAMAPSHALEPSAADEDDSADDDDVSHTDQQALEPTETASPDEGPSSETESSEGGSVDAAADSERVSTATWVGGILGGLFLVTAAGLVWFYGFASGRAGRRS